MSGFALHRIPFFPAILAAEQKFNIMEKTMFQENISAIRISMHLTQAEMAGRLGISRQSYINLEHGRTSLVSKQLVRLSQLCGVPADKLLFGYTKDEIESAAKREIELGKKRLALVERQYENKIALLQEKIDALSTLHESERQHIDVQKKYSEGLEKQLADGRIINSRQRDELMELRERVRLYAAEQ